MQRNCQSSGPHSFKRGADIEQLCKVASSVHGQGFQYWKAIPFDSAKSMVDSDMVRLHIPCLLYLMKGVKWVKVKELIEQLKQFNEDQEVILFDKDSNPKKIDHVVIDTANGGCFNCIVLNDVEE